MTKTKKLLSFILVLALLFGVLPFDRLVIADGTNGYEFLVQPSGGKFSPDGYLTCSWTTNFVPREVQFGYFKEEVEQNVWTGAYYTVYRFYPTRTLTAGFSTSMNLTISYSDISFYGNYSWGIRAFYGPSEEDYVDSKSIGFSFGELEIVTQPKGGLVTVNGGYDLTWETSVRPSSVWLGYYTYEGYWLSPEKIFHLTQYAVDFSRTGSMHVDITEIDTEHEWVMIFYLGSQKVESNIISFKKEFPAFTKQPSGGSVKIGGSINLSWATELMPYSVDIGYYEDDNRYFRVVKTIDDGLAKSMSTTLTYDDLVGKGKTEKWAVRVHYNRVFPDMYVSSNTITITHEPRGFTKEPSDGRVNPDGSYTLDWKTNCVPDKVEIGYLKGGYYNYLCLITDDLKKDMSYTLTYDQILAANSSEWIVRILVDDEWVESQIITLAITDRQFTQEPKNIIWFPGEALTLNWTTNYNPTKVEIGYIDSTDEGQFVPKFTLTDDLARAMSYTVDPHDLDYTEAQNTWCIRVYYGDSGKYLESGKFLIGIARAFTSQPSAGEECIEPGETAKLEWGVNFTPYKVEIGYYSGTKFVAKKTLTSNLNKDMNYSFNYNDLDNTHLWCVRVHYDAGGHYVESNLFKFNCAYYCGDNMYAKLENGTMTIVGTGEMYDYDSTGSRTAPWADERDLIKYLVIPDGVTYIGKNAFVNCSNLYMVTMSPDVTEIGSDAFYGCITLKYTKYDGFKVDWDALDWNSGNDKLRNSSVSYLYRSGTLGKTEIKWQLFGETGRLLINGDGTHTGHIQGGWSNWTEYITEIYVEDGITGIWDEAFDDCTNVRTVRLPNTLISIGTRAFGDCPNLEDVYYNGLQQEWDSIHIDSGNEDLTNATLHMTTQDYSLTGDLSWNLSGDGVLTIFFDDSSMGDGEQTAIPDYSSAKDTPWIKAGYGKYITAIRVEDGVTEIGNHAFDSLTEVKSVEIAEGVTRIGDYAFWLCESVESIALPSSLTSIGRGAFKECFELESIEIPAGVTKIPLDCFLECLTLRYITLPASITSIGQDAFKNCDDLEEIGHVYYADSSSAWKKVNISTGNQDLKNAWIHFTPEEVAINATIFPDKAFRDYVSYFFDTDGNGYLSEDELVNALYIDDLRDVSSLKGIEYLPYLESATITCNQELTSVDLSENKSLFDLDIYAPGLKELDVSEITYLSYLDCSGCSSLTSLELGSNRFLTALNCSGSALSVLDISGCPSLMKAAESGTKTVKNGAVTYSVSNTNYLVFDEDVITIPDYREFRVITIEEDEGCVITVYTKDGELVQNGDLVQEGTELVVDAQALPGYLLVTKPDSSYTVTGDLVIKATTDRAYRLTVTFEHGEEPLCDWDWEKLDAIPYNTTVSLLIDVDGAEPGYEFVGWYTSNGKLISTDDWIDVFVTSDMSIEARFLPVSGVVTFMANDQIVKTITDMETITESDFPANPIPFFGEEFVGWDKTAEEVNAALANGENVTVTAKFKLAEVDVTVTIYNGESETPTIQKYTKNGWASVEAEDVPGKYFSHWEKNGEVLSYSRTAYFETFEDCTITAVYSETEVNPSGIAIMEALSYNSETKDLTAVAYISVPDGAQIVAGGLLAASGTSTKYIPGSELTFDNADYVKTSTKAVGQPGPLSYTWTKTDVNVGDTWYIRPYVTYTIKYTGETVTILGETVVYTAAENT